MDKKFIEKMLAELPDDVVLHEALRRYQNRHERAATRYVQFTMESVEVPAFPLVLYPWPIDIVRHWLLAECSGGVFSVRKCRDACDRQQASYGVPDAGRALLRLRDKGEVVHVGPSIYQRGRSIVLSVGDDMLRTTQMIARPRKQ